MISGKRQDLGNPSNTNCTLDELRQRIKTYYPRQPDTSQHSPQAVVLVLITRSGDPELVPTLHTADLPTHGSEVAFPGGRHDPEDIDLMRTALREAEEEITLPPSLVEVVGPLSTLISRHGIEATPHITLTPDFIKYQPNDGEITAVFSVPLGFFHGDPREAIRRVDYFDHDWYILNYRFGEFKI